MKEFSSQPDLRKYWTIFQRRWIPASVAFFSTITLTALYTFSKTPIYRAEGELLFRGDQSSSLVNVGTSRQLSSLHEDLFTELAVINSKQVLNQTHKKLQGSYDPEQLPSVNGLKNVKVSVLENTKIISVAFNSSDPKLAQLIVNQIMATYVKYSLAESRAHASSAKEFIIKQLPDTRQTLAKTGSALRNFKEKYNLLTVQSAPDRLTGLQKDIEDLEAQLTEQSSKFGDLKNKLGSDTQQALAESILSQSSGVQEALRELQTTERDLAKARATLTATHPAIADLSDQSAQIRSVLRGQIQQALQGQTGPANLRLQRLQVGPTQQDLLDEMISVEISRKSLQDRLSALQKQRSVYQRQVAILPKLEQRQQRLEQELEATKETYQALLKSLQEVKVTENQTIGKVRINELADEPTSPISPNKTSALMAGILIGILLAAATVYVLEVLDRSLKAIDEIRDAYPYPLLGNIPLFPDSPQQMPHLTEELLVGEKYSLYGEAYRMLQSNLKFLSSDKSLRVICVTSAVAQEGKSTTSANLVAALVQMNHRVLLIDADLRKPSQHQIWQIRNQAGLSNVLSGQVDPELDPINAINTNLAVLPSGPIPPNPLVLLDSDVMAQLLEKQLNQYDYIIIDTPPVTISSDALVVGKLSSGMLLVARPGRLDTEAAKLAQHTLRQSGQNILGLVVNGFIPESERHSYYYYSQGYYSSFPEDRELKPSHQSIEMPSGSSRS